MQSQEAKGLLAFWTDIDNENLLEVQKWHNCEHLTERVSIPGFLVGRRYRGIGDAPTFFILYETSETDVLKSEPYLKALDNPTPWTRHALSYFKNNIRNIYTLVSSRGEKAPTEAPYTYVIRFNIQSRAEEEDVKWIESGYLRRICGLDDVHRGTLYQIDEEISNIMTGERAIYGGGPGQQKYLLVFELAALDAPKEEEWQRINDENQGMLRKWKDDYHEFSFLEFVMYSPGAR